MRQGAVDEADNQTVRHVPSRQQLKRDPLGVVHHSRLRERVSDRIALSDLIEYVAASLIQAQEKAQQRGQAVMQFSECEIECAVEVEKEGGGGIKVWILELRGGAKKTEHNTISVKFSPIPGAPPVEAA